MSILREIDTPQACGLCKHPLVEHKPKLGQSALAKCAACAREDGPCK